MHLAEDLQSETRQAHLLGRGDRCRRHRFDAGDLLLQSRQKSGLEGRLAATSAGILLFRRSESGPEVLLVHPGGPFWEKKDLGAWSIPKGEYEEGEDPRACALRELEEELGADLGLDPERLIELGAVRQKGGKVVECWAAEADFDPATLRSNTFSIEWPPRSGAQREFPEVDRAEWFGPEQAREKINPAQAAFLDRLQATIP